jgi:GT2 family glycosyltransferase
MRISVIIPTHNRSEALGMTLSRLRRQRVSEAWDVIVVNNRCTDDTDDLVRRQPFPVPLRLMHEETPGAAAARNAGVAAARGDYLLFIDNDILVGPDFVQRHLDALTAHPGCWIVGQISALPEHEATPFGRYRKTLSPPVPPGQGLSEASGLTGANFSMPRPDMALLGGFDERFDVASHEDLELAVRARKAGIRILFAPGIIGFHNDWAGTSIRDYCRRQRLYCRAEPLFWRKYGDEYCKPDLLRENLPPAWGRDRPVALLRKVVKHCVGARPAQAALVGACELLERAWPWPPVLWRLYRLAVAGAMYRGFQEGLAFYKDEAQKSQHEIERAANHS